MIKANNKEGSGTESSVNTVESLDGIASESLLENVTFENEDFRIPGQGNGKCKGTGAGWYAAGLNYNTLAIVAEAGKGRGKVRRWNER